ncbi:MAG: tetratricopeptide repeat protein [Candidatus Gastranaerophilales bacterium]|nr:tetratricopeptide repeat protein [Candidatus Gastranaerophilales bacterium]
MADSLDKDAKFYTNSGIDKTNSGDFAGALEDFNKSLEIKPDWALTYFSKAIVFHNLQRLEDAFENYSKAIELKPDMVDAYYNRAHVILLDKNNHTDEKELKKALCDLQKAVELDNKFTDAYYYLGVVKMKLKDYKGAVNELDKVLALEPDAIHSKALKKLLLQKYIK